MVKKYALLFFFLLAYLFTWSNWLPQALASRGFASIQTPGLVTILAGYGPALAAIVMVSLAGGRAGLRELFGRLVKWRVGIQWYLIALFLPAFGLLLAIAVNQWTGGSIPDFAAAGFLFGPADTPLWQKLIILFLVFTLGFDGIGEELGWRGFALPKLLENRSPLVASLILGAFWAVWHFPYALTQGSFLSQLPLHWFFLNLLAVSIMYTWIFLHTNGSLLLALLFHAAGSITGNLLPTLPPAAPDLRIYYFTIAINCLLALGILFLTNWNSQSQKNVPANQTHTDKIPT